MEVLRQTFGRWYGLRDAVADEANAREEVRRENEDAHSGQGADFGNGEQGDEESRRGYRGEDEALSDFGNEEDFNWGDPEAMDRETAAQLERIHEVAGVRCTRVHLYQALNPLSSC